MGDNGEANALFDDIESELASIRVVTDRERLDQPRETPKRAAVHRAPPRTIDTRGIDINRVRRSDDPTPEQATQQASEPPPPMPEPQHKRMQAAHAPRPSLAERLSMVRGDD